MKSTVHNLMRFSLHQIAGKVCLLCTAVLVLIGCTTADPATPTPTPAYQAIPQVYLGAHAIDTELEEEIGYAFPVQLFYLGWGNPFSGGGFARLAARGRIGLATWEFRQGLNGPQDPYALKPLQAIVDGKHDKYLRTFAQDAKAFVMPLFLRWGHEMNGDWYTWSGSNNGGEQTGDFGDPSRPDGPERFVAAYQHIHDLFDAEGADNVLWVWCPNIAMQGELGAAWNAIANYYPGADYVDWLCMDGYNWGASQDWSSWQSFDQVFSETYTQLQALDPGKPIMIGETASTEEGGDKAAWISDAAVRLQSAYPQVRLLVWFNLNKETDWRINSSPASLKAFQQALKQYAWGQVPWPGTEQP